MNALIIIGIAVALTGCGKTIEQIKQVGHSVIDVAGKVYEDAADNAKTAKDVVVGEEKK